MFICYINGGCGNEEDKEEEKEDEEDYNDENSEDYDDENNNDDYGTLSKAQKPQSSCNVYFLAIIIIISFFSIISKTWCKIKVAYSNRSWKVQTQ